MSELLSLRDAQKRTLQLMNYEDGLWDLLLGIIFMMLAVYPITRRLLGPIGNLALFLGLMLLAVIAQLIVRWRFSTPRLGYVVARRSPALKLTAAVTILLVALTFGLVMLTLLSPGLLPKLSPSGAPTGLRPYLVDILALLAMVGLFSAMGYVFSVPRLYFYGWLLGCSNLISHMLYQGAPDGFNFPLGIAAGIILMIGLGLLIRFVRRYPVSAAEA